MKIDRQEASLTGTLTTTITKIGADQMRNRRCASTCQPTAVTSATSAELKCTFLGKCAEESLSQKSAARRAAHATARKSPEKIVERCVTDDNSS